MKMIALLSGIALLGTGTAFGYESTCTVDLADPGNSRPVGFFRFVETANTYETACAAAQRRCQTKQKRLRADGFLRPLACILRTSAPGFPPPPVPGFPPPPVPGEMPPPVPGELPPQVGGPSPWPMPIPGQENPPPWPVPAPGQGGGSVEFPPLPGQGGGSVEFPPVPGQGGGSVEFPPLPGEIPDAPEPLPVPAAEAPTLEEAG